MTSEANKLLEIAIRLSPRERAELAGKLLDSLDGLPEEDPNIVEKAWEKEIKRRIQDHEEGRNMPVPWEEARHKIFGETDEEN